MVLYGGNNNWFAAYAYWYFKLYGHDDVKLLDGGRKKWELDSRELTDELPNREQTSYTAKEQDRSIRAFRDETVAAIGTQNLVDVRSPDEYAGRLLAPAHLPQEQAQRAGHIPTAANVPWSKAANDDGTFKSDDELKELYTEAGVDWEQGHHRLLPDRRALLAHLVRAQGAAGPGQRQELRRLLDRVRLARRRPGRPRRRAGRGLMCGATEGGLSLDGVDVTKEAVIQGQVVRATASRSATPTSGCSTGPVSSPPRSRPRRPGTSGSSPATATGRCAPWRRRPTRSTTPVHAAVGSVAEVTVSL